MCLSTIVLHLYHVVSPWGLVLCLPSISFAPHTLFSFSHLQPYLLHSLVWIRLCLAVFASGSAVASSWASFSIHTRDHSLPLHFAIQLVALCSSFEFVGLVVLLAFSHSLAYSSVVPPRGFLVLAGASAVCFSLRGCLSSHFQQ